MRENRPSGSEGGAIQSNVSFLPLSTIYEAIKDNLSIICMLVEIMGRDGDLFEEWIGDGIKFKWNGMDDHL
jgi:hypothetical protein